MTLMFGSVCSVCSGIEAASAAWHPLDWRAAFVSEIEAFPCAVLAHHYPDVPNHGDMTQFAGWPDAALDVLVGGTPCQSFSVAGLRKGLADPRGNLMLTYGAIADRYRPFWVVWENVPGVLSSNGGMDFAAFLGMLAKLGYGFAYRILDAQHFGVPQRRRRVFVVGCLGGWRCAAAVLFERASLRGDSAPRREAGKEVAATIRAGAPGRGPGNRARSGDSKDELITIAPAVSPALKARDFKGPSSDGDGDGAPLIAHALRADGFDASEDGTGRGTPLVVADTLRGHPRPGSNSIGACAFGENIRGEVVESPVARALQTGGGKPGQGYPAARTAAGVRRLTPRECERLQGFPDDYTAITVRGKPAADGPRYKALGNSMAVPVMRWIGSRIDAVHAIARRTAA